MPCSRRSSYGFNNGSSPVTSSRRSSFGSQVNLSNLSDESSELKVQTNFNKVMNSNQKAMIKPKDVKFKRINKAKSR